MDRIAEAKEFATLAHTGQKRKYTGEPYIVHPIEVAMLVEENGGTEDMIIAALLHDVVEDTTFTNAHIASRFGGTVARLVADLTDVSIGVEGNRAFRKALDRDHIAGASREAQIVKCADLVSNSISIMENDPNFARVYIKEKRMLLEAMTKATDHPLFDLAMDILAHSEFKLGL